MINKSDNFQVVIALKAGAIASYGTGSTNISNNGGTINLVYINPGAHVKLNAFYFVTNYYNLFVIDDVIENYGSFFIPFNACHKNTEINHILDIAFVNYTLNFPSLIATKNAHKTQADESQIAIIAKVHDAVVLENGIKFRYIASKEIKQQEINDNTSTLGILASDQMNELDEIHREIKDLNLFKILDLEEEYGRKEYNKNNRN